MYMVGTVGINIWHNLPGLCMDLLNEDFKLHGT